MEEAKNQLLTKASLANHSAVQVNSTTINVDALLDIDEQKVIEDPDLALCPFNSTCNEADLDEAACVALQECRENCPKRTLRGYKKGLRCWKV